MYLPMACYGLQDSKVQGLWKLMRKMLRGGWILYASVNSSCADLPRGWQMSGPRAAQNLQMPYPRDWQGGQMPRGSPGVAGRSWNWLMHY